jgi:cytidylate kinase
MIIAVDGYSSCGKSTLSRDLADSLGFRYVDTGAMYRAVTLHCINKKVITAHHFSVDDIIAELPNIQIDFTPSGKGAKPLLILNGMQVDKEIRSIEVAGLVSKVSAIPEVRSKMVKLQREMGKKGGVVMDGRDIGTIVFPEAEVKIFMLANPDVRAKRRWLELQANGINISIEEVKNNITMRDKEDTTRKDSPLFQASDAHVLDNSDLTREEQLETALGWVKSK